MDKIDFRKTLKRCYDAPAGRFEVVDLPPMRFFMVDGEGDPNHAPAYARAVEALYTASYALKFASKKALGRDYVVPPLEGLWWARDYESFLTREKHKWSWTMMIMIPDFVGMDMTDEAIRVAVAKRGPEAAGKLRTGDLEEGRVVQTMHIGSYDDEGPVLKRLHEEFLPAQGLVEAGLHHEIYLGDPRKTPPERLKTILRQPVTSRL